MGVTEVPEDPFTRFHVGNPLGMVYRIKVDSNGIIDAR